MELTPMMRQYLEMKEQNPGCLLFFRLGDFYEMFHEDAKIASRELDLTLTTRDRNKDKEDQTPMCGVPYHASEGYIARLVSKGYKVAICEQMEDPATTKGLVKREITRIVTPGSVTESSMLDERKNNWFGCLYGLEGKYGLSFCDVSTGMFSATITEDEERVVDELGRFQPREILMGGEAIGQEILEDALVHRVPCCVEHGQLEDYDYLEGMERLKAQFSVLPELPPAVVCSAGALLKLLKEYQKSELPHVRTLEFYQTGRYMDLDPGARRNLELTQNLRTGEKKGSLLGIMDHTRTPMGSRLLRSWMEFPLMDPRKILRRQEAVEELVGQTVLREELIRDLRQVSDLERIMARVSTGTCSARDLRQLSNGVETLPNVLGALQKLSSSLWQVLTEEMDDLADLKARIDAAIVDDPPFSVREGGMIRPGCCEELDQLHDILNGGKDTLPRIEQREKEATGIKNLRVGYNRVFGYYIEIAKSQCHLAPDHYIRRQTLANGERYITPELKELENTILTARDRVTALEYELFSQLRQEISDNGSRIQKVSQVLAATDVLACFASNAVKHNYCRPEVDMSDVLEIRDGRHPVVEQMLKGQLFVPNDTSLGQADCRSAIITGPNMAGKSTYMRQVALMVLMAQMGSFVPAKSARIGVVDRIFTRIGASDDLASGQSTFMVEMREVAEMLHRATPRSLLILDEIGRGTSTYDGMAIARAVLEHVADPRGLGAKSLFATHYHELTTLERELPGVRNYNISVKKRQGEMIFLRKIIPGAADRSYGVEVAKLAGLPDKVVSRARALLKELEAGGGVPAAAPEPEEFMDQISMMDMDASAIRQRLEQITVQTLTPIGAMNLLYELKQMLQ